MVYGLFKLSISSNGNKPKHYSEPSSFESILALMKELIDAQDAAGNFCQHCHRDVIPDRLTDIILRCPDCKGLLKQRFNYKIVPA